LNFTSKKHPLFSAVDPQLSCFTRFREPTDHYPLPERFTFPFYYQPHPLSILAAKTLQNYLTRQTDFDHNFGLEPGKSGEEYGKMFGVLVVQNHSNEIGYLAAFSGKLAGETHHSGFVPPVFDLLDTAGFYRKEEAALNAINRRIENLEQNPQWPKWVEMLARETAEAARCMAEEKEKMKVAKLARKQRREAIEPPFSPDEAQVMTTALIEESKQDHYKWKDLRKYWQQRLQSIQAQIDQITAEIQALKELRRAKSSALQQKIFDQYFFLNALGAQKSLADIFQHNAATPPPSGAGECAAPKLLQYAFLHQLKPIAMAEFWWGASPAGEIRKHGHYYPACRGKCEPILAHMLEGIELDENPLMAGMASEQVIKILYEDEHLLVINKPPTLLSVPGKGVTDSVYLRLKRQYPDATGPLMVHRLDMSTSGLMLVAKTSEIHKDLQSQFLRRTVKKRYVAVLEGIVSADDGIIDLPLRVDLDDRPRQMVCYQYGKYARTEWKVVSRSNETTRVHFYPITGRTHQLRVHAAHPKGLNTPIKGDEIYGNPADRLYLHADCIEFSHPVTGERMRMEESPNF